MRSYGELSRVAVRLRRNRDKVWHRDRDRGWRLDRAMRRILAKMRKAG